MIECATYMSPKTSSLLDVQREYLRPVWREDTELSQCVSTPATFQPTVLFTNLFRFHSTECRRINAELQKRGIRIGCKVDRGSDLVGEAGALEELFIWRAKLDVPADNPRDIPRRGALAVVTLWQLKGRQFQRLQ
jgi:hypothetical protein